MLSFSRLNLRLLAAKARNINNPNAKNAMTPTVIDDIVATKIIMSCNCNHLAIKIRNVI